MNTVFKACLGALLVAGLTGVASLPAAAGGTHWDPSCNCRRPDAVITKKRYVHARPRVVVHKRYVKRTRYVRGKTKLLQENRVTVHVRPVIHREVVVHRTNTIVKDVLLYRVRHINRYRNVYRSQRVDVYRPGSVRHVLEVRRVRGCGCGRDYVYSRD
jgi:hypothetical protein